MKSDRFYLICILVLLFSVDVFSQRISLNTTTWTVNLRDEITEAGTDFIGTYTSDIDQAEINIFDSPGFVFWFITIRYTPIVTGWDDDLIIEARRTSNGTGGISFGFLFANFTPLTTVDSIFLFGLGNVSGITSQYRLRGVSVVNQDGRSTHNIRVTYTVNPF